MAGLLRALCRIEISRHTERLKQVPSVFFSGGIPFFCPIQVYSADFCGGLGGIERAQPAICGRPEKNWAGEARHALTGQN